MAWTALAGCRPFDREPLTLWVSRDPDCMAAAIAMCRSHCPVRIECGITALYKRVGSGIYAGFDMTHEGNELWDWLVAQGHHRANPSLSDSSTWAGFRPRRPDLGGTR